MSETENERMKFADLGLSEGVLQSLRDIGYDELTPIQEAAIPHILGGRDLIGLAETGSGKTTACAIPLVQMVDPEVKDIQAISANLNQVQRTFDDANQGLNPLGIAGIELRRVIRPGMPTSPPG